MIKWNKALRARQKALGEEQQKEAARQEADRRERVAERRVEDGTTLNGLLAQILDFDPGTARSAPPRPGSPPRRSARSPSSGTARP